MILRDEFIKSLESSSMVDLLFQGRNEDYIKWLEEKVKKLTTHNSDYAKCLSCAEDITTDYDININPELIAKTIGRHFA